MNVFLNWLNEQQRRWFVAIARFRAWRQNGWRRLPV